MSEKFGAEKIAAIYTKVRAYWDAQADQFNQWTELGDDEKVAVAYAAGQREMRERAAKEADIIEAAYDSTLPQKDRLQLESHSKARACGEVAEAIRAIPLEGE